MKLNIGVKIICGLKRAARPEKPHKKGGFAALVMSILVVWPSYTLEIYLSDSSPLSAPLTKMDESLLGSLPALGAMLGTVIAGPILDMFGRRNGGVLVSLPFVVSWALIEISSSVTVVLIARFLGGVAGGGTLVLSAIIISETSEDSIRGSLAALPVLQTCMGTLMSYMIGWCLSYNVAIWTNVGLSVICTLLIMFTYETPMHYLRQGRFENARKAIAKYRGVAISSMTVSDELYRLKQLGAVSDRNCVFDSPTKAEEAEGRKLNLQENEQKRKQISSFKLLLTSPSSRRALIVVLLLMTLQNFMGMVAVQVYLNAIFSEADPSKAGLFTVLFAVMQIFASIVIIVAADKTGRRFLQISSSAFICLCLACLGAQLQFRVAPPWVTVVLIMAYCFFFIMGAGSVPYILLAEVFAPEVLNLATMVVIEWIWLMNFVILGIFPYMVDFFGIHGTFYTFSAVSLACTFISHYMLPETTGLSNEQIQEAFLPKMKRVPT